MRRITNWLRCKNATPRDQRELRGVRIQREQGGEQGGPTRKIQQRGKGAWDEEKEPRAAMTGKVMEKPAPQQGNPNAGISSFKGCVS